MLRTVSSCTIDALPIELIRRIFSSMKNHDLCVCACVCQMWSPIALEPDFWRHISFRGVGLDTVSRICARYPLLQTLELRHISSDSTSLAAIVQGCQMIQSLTISDVLGSLRLGRVLARAPQSLRRLDVSTVSVADDLLRRIDTYLPLLESFDMSHCTLVPPENTMLSVAIRALFLKHPSLREFRAQAVRLSSLDILCPNLEVLDVSYVKLTDVMLPTATRSPGLKVLLLAECRNITDNAVKDVLTRCIFLTEVDLSGCVCLTADVLRAAAGDSSAPSLRTLHMARCPLLTNLGSDDEALHTSKLQCLNLSACEQLKSLDVQSSSLKHLDLAYCHHLCLLSARCPRLKVLHLEDCEALATLELRGSPRTLDFGDARSHLKSLVLCNEHLDSLDLQSFSAMELLRLQCPGLTSLDLTRCAALQSSSVDELLSSCPALQRLALEECEGLHKLVLTSSSLTELDLSGCKSIEEADISCAKLHTLVLEGCSGLVRVAIRCALHTLDLGTCRQLQGLELSSELCRSLCVKGCLRLSEASLRCPSLRTLDLSFCGEFTDEALTALCTESLSELNISRCVRISNAAIMALSRVCIGQRLHTPPTLQCGRSHAPPLPQLFPSLQTVNLSYLAVDDETLLNLLSQPLHLSAPSSPVQRQ